MRFSCLFVLLFVFPGIMCAQEFDYHRYEGTIGDKRVVLHLHKNAFREYVNGENLNVVQYRGMFYNAAHDMPVAINGSPDEAGRLNLYEARSSMQLVQTGTTLSGTWTDEGSTKTYPVELREAYPNGSVAFTGYSFYDRKPLFPQKNTSPGMQVNLCWLEPSGKMPEETRKFLREVIHREMMGTTQPCCPGPEKAFETIRDEQFRMYDEEFRETLQQDPEMPEHMMNFSDEQVVAVLYNDKHLLSLGFTHYFYSGGAHGNYATTTRSYDLKKRKAIELSDVFSPGYEKPLEGALDRAARVYMELKPTDKLENAYLVEKIPVTDNFYLTGKGIVFSYPPYEIAAYANGQIDLFIPFDQLGPWVK
ncbi:MAG: DUF3298 domain-containing protein [Saprospiraceae bacterium]|nr:DUF3298 domain-containing protein [Saprospiraceae bacterium]